LRDCTAFFEIRKLEIFKDQRRDLIDVDFRLVIIRARILSGLARTSAAARATLATNHIADARFTVALADVFCFLIVEAKLVFVECFDGNFDGALSVGQDDRLIRNNRTEIFTDGFLNAILVALLIDDALALQ
jgi:hypothetical protein